MALNLRTITTVVGLVGVTIGGIALSRQLKNDPIQIQLGGATPVGADLTPEDLPSLEINFTR